MSGEAAPAAVCTVDCPGCGLMLHVEMEGGTAAASEAVYQVKRRLEAGDGALARERMVAELMPGGITVVRDDLTVVDVLLAHLEDLRTSAAREGEALRQQALLALEVSRLELEARQRAEKELLEVRADLDTVLREMQELQGPLGLEARAAEAALHKAEQVAASRAAAESRSSDPASPGLRSRLTNAPTGPTPG